MTPSNSIVCTAKTEDYEIIRKGNEKWKKWKLLGSLLDTEKDINRRKILAMDAFKTLNKIFDSRKINQNFQCIGPIPYVASVSLYPGFFLVAINPPAKISLNQGFDTILHGTDLHQPLKFASFGTPPPVV